MKETILRVLGKKTPIKEVLADSAELEYGSLIGKFIGRINEVHYADNLSIDNKQEVILHEIIEMISGEICENKIIHRDIQALSAAVYALLMDNKKFFKRWLE